MQEQDAIYAARRDRAGNEQTGKQTVMGEDGLD